MDMNFADLNALERHISNLHTVRLIGEKLASDRLMGLMLQAPDQAAERVLSSIQTDAWSQRLEIDEVLSSLRRLTRGPAFVSPATPEPSIGFAEQVESLSEVKRDSADLYEEAATDCPDETLAARLRALAREDREHAVILAELGARARGHPVP